MKINSKKMFTPTISGKPTTVYAVNYDLIDTTKKVSEKTEETGKIHYVDILDRSGSMYQVINDVVNHTQSRIKNMRKDDLITVIWFSSQGDFKVVLRGATPSDGVISILDSLRSVRNLTCFSDAIGEAESAVFDLKGLVGGSIVTLLTDGHPVTNNNQKEMEKCIDMVNAMKNSILAFNTIGFGNYYNREFLNQLSSASNFGALRHISDIGDFNTAYSELVSPLSMLVQSEFVVYSPDASIMYISNDGAVSNGVNELTMGAQSDTNNTVFVINPTAISLESGDEQDVLDLKTFSKTAGSKDSSYLTFLYMYADYMFNKANKRDVALDIIAKNIKDRALADALTNAFSYDEIGEFNNLLQDCIKDNEGARMSGGVCPPKYVPATNAPCLFDVLNILANADLAKYIPYPKDNKYVKPYERIARKTVDEQNAFAPIPAQDICSDIDLVYAGDKLNVSMRFEVPGRVAINARAAERAGLQKVWDSKIYRTHTIIKDGNLNIPAACFIVDADTYDKLIAIKGLVKDKKLAIIKGAYGNKDFPCESKDGILVTMLFNKIPIINRSYADQVTAEAISKATLEELRLEVDQKVYGYIIGKAYEKVTIAEKQGVFSNLTLDQIEVLKDHGISKANVYGAISPKTALATDCDFYEIRILETYVKGFTTLPPVEKSITKPKKTASEQAIFDAYEAIIKKHGVIFEKLNKAAVVALEAVNKDIKIALLEIRNKMSAIKISTVLNNVWFEGVTIDEKGKAELLDNVVMNVKYGKEYIDVPVTA